MNTLIVVDLHHIFTVDARTGKALTLQVSAPEFYRYWQEKEPVFDLVEWKYFHDRTSLDQVIHFRDLGRIEPADGIQHYYKAAWREGDESSLNRLPEKWTDFYEEELQDIGFEVLRFFFLTF